MTETDRQWVLKYGAWSSGSDHPSLPVESQTKPNCLKRRSLCIISPVASDDATENDDTLDYSMFNFKPRFTPVVNLRSSPVSASACDITEAFNKSVFTGGQFQQRFRSRSSSISASSASSTSSTMALSNYSTPADIKPTKTRTKSFSPGSGFSSAALKGKYKLSNHSFRSRSSSVSTFSPSSNSSVSSSSSPISAESTEQFWNQYRRQQTSTSFLGKLLNRALSRRQVYCEGPKYIGQSDSRVEESNASDNEEEDLYDEMYSEMFEDIFEVQPPMVKKTTRNCDNVANYSQKREIIL